MTTPLTPAVDAPVDLPSSVRALARARATLAATQATVNASREEFITANAELLARLDAEERAVANARAVIDALALSEYARLSIKKLTAGVEIKLRGTMVYDKAQAFGWAQLSKLALTPESLDVKAFEKIAKATPLPFVQYGEEPIVNVSSDLSALL